MAQMELGCRIDRPCRRARRTVDLRVRLVELARSTGVDPTFVPQDQHGVDRLHAFRVLAHAEIEGFVESLVLRVLKVTKDFAKAGQLTHAGHHLLVSWCIGRTLDRDKAQNSAYPPFIAAVAINEFVQNPQNLRSALQQHESRVRSNHGIKERNLRPLLLPIGCREEFFAPDFFNKMTTLGEARGSVAHASGIVGAQQWPSGSQELSRLADIAKGLSVLEGLMPRLLLPA